jgi:hypothetical protein
MPTLRKLPDGNIGSMLAMQEHFGLMQGVPGQQVHITPIPQGPESVQLRRMLEEVLSSLAALETLRPYFEEAHEPYSRLFDRLEESDDYQSPPPTRTVTMNTRFFIRGRGQPKPYPLEDE